MDLFETLGLGPRQPEENELYVAIYADPVATDDAAAAADAWEDPDEAGSRCAAAPAADDEGAASSSGRAAGGPSPVDDRLEALRARCTAWLLPYTTDYVWNKDPLVLRASSCQPPPWERRRGGAPGGRRRAPHAAGEDGPQAGAGLSSSSGPGEGCVWAVMRFGDAVDDEWWAVWLLLRMTRELQDLSVQVWDNDGQFLLIEAAYALPRWLKPETADNRVWLRRGRLHVIPLPSSTAPDLPPSPSVVQALEVLREDRFSTASQRVQRPIDERLARYPARARREQQHTARCLLPVPLAAALRSEPQLVAELVEAFYHRDAEDMRAAARMRVLPASLERVPALVRMTRVHYAQLAQQRFSAPRGLPMPPPDSPLAKAADLGLKLTVAAEIICARVHPQYQPQTRGDGHSEQSQQPALLEDATAATEAVAGVQGQQQAGEATAAGARGAAGGVLSEARFSADPAWRRFKSSLEANGYFQGNIAGSRRYKELLAAALEAFAAGLAVDGEGGDAAGRSAAGGGAASSVDPRRRLAELVRGAAAGGLRAADVADASNAAEDDDSWLEQQPDRLEAELDRRQAELKKPASRHGNDASAQGASAEEGTKPPAQGPVKEVDADDIASKLRSFMEQLSGLEGVETSGVAPGGAGSGGGGGGVDFNPARFLRELEQVLGAARTTGRDSKRQRQEQDPGGQDGDDEEEGEGETSTEEGSSFFSSDEEEDENDISGEGDDDEDDDAQADRAAGSGLGFGFEAGRTGQDQTTPAASSAAAATVAGAAVPAATTAAAAAAVRRAQPAGHAAAARDARPQAALNAPVQPGTTAAAAHSTATQPQAVLKRGFLSAAKPGGKVAEPAAMGAGLPGAATAGRAAAAAAAGRRGSVPAASRSGASLPATAPAGGSSASRRQQLDWETRTATDSDDEDEVSERGGREGKESDYEDDEEGDATVRLLAALGVDSGDEDGGTASNNGDDDGGSGPGASGSRGGPADWQRQQRRGVGRDKATAVAVAAASKASGAGGRSGRGDNDGDSFMPLYNSAMQDELAGTTLAQSFDYGLGPSGAGGRGVAGGAGGGGVEGAARGAGTGEPGVARAGTQGQVLQPVDLDMNLVRNLLRSYTAQQGSAGPAGNMAAMLGMVLPAGDVMDD